MFYAFATTSELRSEAHYAWADETYPGWEEREAYGERFLSPEDFPAGTPVYAEEVTADDMSHYGPRY